MKKILGLFILYAILCIHTINTFASVRIEGGHSTKASLKEKSNVECYIVSSAGNSVLFFEGPANSTVKKYHTKADDAEIINGARYENGAWRIDNPEMNCGYILELPRGLTEYYWLLEYNTADFEKEKISVYDDPNDPCNYIRIKVDGGFSSWMIKAPNGKNIAVDRQFHIRYKDLKYNEESEKFYAIDKDEYIGVIDGELQLFSPLMDTDFTLVGDNYNEALQITFKEIKSNVFLAKRMELHTYIKVESEQKSNNEGEKRGIEDVENALPKELSAPTTIEMRAIANEPVTQRYNWKIYKGRETTQDSPIVMQYSGAATTYTFSEAGTYTISCESTNRTEECTIESEAKVVNVSTSHLEVPNAFSPFSSPGINDEFRVAHKSIIHFKGVIYNEWGNKLFQWEDPSIGWNGTVNGRPVPQGVYYYIIQAQGADGKEYNLSGDINILNSDIEYAPDNADNTVISK